MRVTATNREVRESLALAKRYKSEEIMSISPALVTETENPVRVIYSNVKIIPQTVEAFLPKPNKFNSLDSPIVSIARCIPLSASMCEIPILEKSSLVPVGR